MSQVLHTRLGRLVAIILAWLSLAILAALALIQLRLTLLATASWIIDTPSLRPTGWTTGSVVAIDKLAFIVLGGLWLGYVTFLERALGISVKEGRFWRFVGRSCGSLVALGVGLYLVRMLV